MRQKPRHAIRLSESVSSAINIHTSNRHGAVVLNYGHFDLALASLCEIFTASNAMMQRARMSLGHDSIRWLRTGQESSEFMTGTRCTV